MKLTRAETIMQAGYTFSRSAFHDDADYIWTSPDGVSFRATNYNDATLLAWTYATAEAPEAQPVQPLTDLHAQIAALQAEVTFWRKKAEYEVIFADSLANQALAHLEAQRTDSLIDALQKLMKPAPTEAPATSEVTLTEDEIEWLANQHIEGKGFRAKAHTFDMKKPEKKIRLNRNLSNARYNYYFLLPEYDTEANRAAIESKRQSSATSEDES